MKNILIAIFVIILSLSGFSQSVTILPSTSLGGGSSQWTTSGSNITYGNGSTNNVGIGTTNPIFPLVVRSNGGVSNQPVFLIERANNQTPHQGFVKFGGTASTAAPLTTGEMGLISFGGSTSTDFGSWGIGSSIRAVAKGTFSNTSTPGQLEFATSPTGGNSTLLTRMTINEEGKIGINNNTPIAQLDLRYDGSSFHSVHNPMLNINGPTSNPVFVRYSNSPTTNFSILQEATPGLNLNNTNIKWRWYDNASPSVGTTMFEWANNSFNVTGALSTSGNATINGTSALRGKTTIGTLTTSGNGLEIQSSISNSAAPDIYIKSPNNVIRYGGTSGNAGMMQSVINSATPGSASMAFVHLDNATPPTQTMMMTLDGEGDMTAFGFTKLGGSAADVPAIKTKLLTGNIAAASNQSTSVAHGLTLSKIINVKVLVTGLGNKMVSGNFVDFSGTSAGYEFSTFTDALNVHITRSATNSINITPASGLVPTYKIFITYIQ